MKYFVYLISDHKRKNIHAGYSTDIPKAIDFYNEINDLSLNWPIENYLNRMVLLEEVPNEGHAINRVTYFTHLPLKNRIEEILAINPDWVDLTADPNFKEFVTV